MKILKLQIAVWTQTNRLNLDDILFPGQNCHVHPSLLSLRLSRIIGLRVHSLDGSADYGIIEICRKKLQKHIKVTQHSCGGLKNGIRHAKKATSKAGICRKHLEVRSLVNSSAVCVSEPHVARSLLAVRDLVEPTEARKYGYDLRWPVLISTQLWTGRRCCCDRNK